MNQRVEHTAQTFVAGVTKDLGPKTALARARRMRWEYPKTRQPQWLTRAIEILTEMDRK